MMTTIAHLTDLHLVEDGYRERPLRRRARLSYLSFGRPLAPRGRRERALSALAEARAANPDHLLLTGDLTEDGQPAQFEALAEVLAESRIAPERITLVPGNHDAYSSGHAFAEALAGPLKPFAETSRAGARIALRDATLVPVSTAFCQTVLRSAGGIDGDELTALIATAADPALAGKPLVFAQHHPPGRHYLGLMQWIDGIAEHRVLTELFARSPHLYVVHGHTHKAVNKSTVAGGAPRIFSAEAVVDSAAPLRLYEASASGLTPLSFDVPEGVAAALSA